MFTEKDFISPVSNFTPYEISFQQEAPSNIALVKYWGKYDGQIPMNPSISFTLNKSKTITKAVLKPLNSPSEKLKFRFFLDDKHQLDFEPKIASFFDKIKKYVPFVFHYSWEFYSHNSFPHSSGIASSASGFAALAKLIIDLEKQIYPNNSEIYFNHKTSFLARLGSGSAARSTEHPVMIWGQHPEISDTSDLYAVKPDFGLHSDFKNFRDSIVLVEKGQKKVSSTKGHQLMNNHPFKAVRKQQAFENTLKMTEILSKGNIEDFIDLVEAEALSLHALMMTSTPNYILMQPDTLRIIKDIRDFRNRHHIPVCFTLDAGANVHILYPDSVSDVVQNTLLYFYNFDIIDDFI